jgi:hypothetical protein
VGAGNPKLTFSLALGLAQMQGGLCHANAIGLEPKKLKVRRHDQDTIQVD